LKKGKKHNRKIIYIFHFKLCKSVSVTVNVTVNVTVSVTVNVTVSVTVNVSVICIKKTDIKTIIVYKNPVN